MRALLRHADKYFVRHWFCPCAGYIGLWCLQWLLYIYIYIYNIESSYQIPKGPKDKIEYTSNQASGSNTNEGFCTEVDEN